MPTSAQLRLNLEQSGGSLSLFYGHEREQISFYERHPIGKPAPIRRAECNDDGGLLPPAGKHRAAGQRAGSFLKLAR